VFLILALDPKSSLSASGTHWIDGQADSKPVVGTLELLLDRGSTNIRKEIGNFH